MVFPPNVLDVLVVLPLDTGSSTPACDETIEETTIRIRAALIFDFE
jgi:hypothetical protein